MPHVYCLRDPQLVRLQSFSDAVIALSYFCIPISLILLVRRRRDLVFPGAFVLFGVFILACGATHVLEIVTLWIPVYRLQGLVKAITAAASFGTAVLLVRLLPQAVALPSPAQLRHEIEERRLAEDQVRRLNAELEDRVDERTRQLQSATASAADLAATLDKAQAIVQRLDGTIVYWNSGAEALYGWTRDEALGRKSHELLRSELPESHPGIQIALLEHGAWSGEFKQYCRDGSEIWVTSHWVLHRGPSGEPVSVVKVNNDITAFKRTAEALRLSEVQFRTLANAIDHLCWITDGSGSILWCNERWYAYTGTTEEQMAGIDVPSLHDADLYAEIMERWRHSLATGTEFEMVFPLRGANGSFRSFLNKGVPVRNAAGAVVRWFGTNTDITERQEAIKERESLIEQLKSALNEKTVLLKEVHHRVKNNLAVIAGLLEMQSHNLKDPRAQAALAESERRVMSMALIHEYLYASEHLDSVNFGEYVHELARELEATYAVAPGFVEVSIEAEEIDLPVHLAIPCGLILNELLSNAFKYAFPDGRNGKIEVAFRRLPSGELFLSCADNGAGIPEAFDWQKAKSLGLRIIGILAKQIDGTLNLDRTQPGARFDLTFPAGKEMS